MTGTARLAVVFVGWGAVLLSGASPAAADPAAPATPLTTIPSSPSTTVAPPRPMELAPPGSDPFGSPPPPAATAGGQEATPTPPRPEWFDVAGRIRQAIDGWFRAVVEDAIDPVVDLVARTVLSTPDVTAPGRVRDLWLVSWGIVNAVFILVVIAAGLVAMSYQSFERGYAVKELLPRVAVGWISANASLGVAHLAIGFANAASRAFLDQSVDGAGAVASLRQLMVGSLATGGIFVILIALAVVILGVGLVGVYVVRICSLVVLVTAAPLFLATHALPYTDGAARLWWRALTGCLAVQMGQALIFITALRVFFDSDGRRLVGLPVGPLMDLLVVGSLFWLMLRLPGYARRAIFTPRANIALQAVRYQLVGRGVRAAATAAKTAAA